MAQNKTQPTEENVIEFINSFANTEQKIKDSYQLIEIMKEVSGFEPKMWGPSIIGFGEYHYKYATGHQGNAPMLGFSPRKSNISLYVYSGSQEHKNLLENLGKFKMGKSCIYVKKLADINLEELKTLMKETIQFLKTTYEQD